MSKFPYLLISSVMIFLLVTMNEFLGILTSFPQSVPWLGGEPKPGRPSPIPWRFLSESQLTDLTSPVSFVVPPWVFAHSSPITSPIPEEALLADSKTFKAQSGEDRLALEHFFGGTRSPRRGGVILESGALDGDTFSTSYVFETALSWRAVHVEASPEMFSRLVRNRPRALNVHAALCSEARTLHLAFRGPEQPDAVGGIWELMTPTFRSTFWADLTPAKIAALPTVACMPLAPLLMLFGISHIDLWVLDVEGGELEVLQSVDFAALVVDVLVVETDGTDNIKDGAVSELLAERGFANLGRVHQNTWFVNREGPFGNFSVFNK